MFIKVTKENLDYINKARQKYNTSYKDFINTYTNVIDISKNNIDPLRTSNSNRVDKFISFEEFKKQIK
jgi:hypothetical protein